MKIIFLDFDGVLNSRQEVYYHARIRQNRPVLNFLRTLIYKPVDRAMKFIEGWKRFDNLRRGWIYFYLYYLTDHANFCPIATSNIQNILDKDDDVRIVVSSVWRSWGIPYLKKILKNNGIDPTKLVGTTGYEEGQRGLQCMAWLDRNRASMGITHCVAIDDDGDFDDMLHNFVQTDAWLGFTMRDAEKVEQILEIKEDLIDSIRKGKRKLRIVCLHTSLKAMLQKLQKTLSRTA